jgi:hypothetical protein
MCLFLFRRGFLSASSLETLDFEELLRLSGLSSWAGVDLEFGMRSRASASPAQKIGRGFLKGTQNAEARPSSPALHNNNKQRRREKNEGSLNLPQHRHGATATKHNNVKNNKPDLLLPSRIINYHFYFHIMLYFF